MKALVHFRPREFRVPIKALRARVACGLNRPSGEITSSPAKTTCGNCRRSQLFGGLDRIYSEVQARELRPLVRASRSLVGAAMEAHRVERTTGHRADRCRVCNERLGRAASAVIVESARLAGKLKQHMPAIRRRLLRRAR